MGKGKTVSITVSNLGYRHKDTKSAVVTLLARGIQTLPFLSKKWLISVTEI